VSQRILVLGASGYIGQHLVKRLSEQGFTVLAAARQIDRLKKQQLPGVECYSLDLNQPDALPALLAQADTVYYLVHGMGEGGDFIRHERRVALNVRDALRKSPVNEVIFLSSLQVAKQEQSDHLRARQITGDLLRESGVPVAEVRAGIIVGAGSAAFEVMRDMVYNLPVLTPPRWVRSRTTPIALENLLYYLLQLLNHPAREHRVFEAAGPEILSYQQQFIRFMAVSGKRRPLIPIPFPTRWISVWFLNVITSVPPTTAKALIQGLKHDLIADDRALRALIPQPLIAFDEAVRLTLKEEEQLVNSSDWGYDAQAFARWRPEYGYYPKQAGCTVNTSASLARCGRWSTKLAAKRAISSATCCGKRAGRWTCWSAIGWQKVVRKSVSANRRRGGQLEGDYRRAGKAADAVIRHESARPWPPELYPAR
jgi:uncharacterized protein YbjT (DUF2867 family)